MEKSTIYSIGHGNKSIETLIEELKKFDINYLIDIRSKPYSKYNPQFNRDEIKYSLENNGIRYTFMGDILGGLPDDITCYTNGHVDYNKLKDKDFFKKGLARLVTAHTKKIKVAIMCSESNPAECHRTKLIGEELKKKAIIINHITRAKKTKKIIIKDQTTVMLEVAPNGKINLFGEELTFMSRKKYKKDTI
jgi:uncharacterized protein (DUF488 family)